jgi:hypothetical protein
MESKKMQGKRLKDLKVLMDFLEIYCQERHKSKDHSIWKNTELETSIELCKECKATMDYSAKRLKYCPLSPKPACKKCEIHCYEPEQRKKIQEIMRYSGIRLIKKGKLGYVFHYFF